MPTTNRPFFANFFAAFRTQSYVHKASAGTVAPAGSTAGPSCATSSTSSSTQQSHVQPHTQTRQVATKTQPQTTSSTAAAVAAHAAATFSSSRSPPTAAARQQGPPTAAARHRTPSTAAARHHSTSPIPGSHAPIPGSHAPSAPSPIPYARPQRGSFQRSRTPSQTRIGEKTAQRRGSDSSGSDGGGFKDMAASQGWYIGGRTPAGEERFYRLGMVKRWDSADRLSLDRLSL